MAQASRLTTLGRAYISTVILLGFAVVAFSIRELLLSPIGFQWFLLAGLTLISGSATVKLPSSWASISISETFVFTAVLLYGPEAGTLIVALDGLVISFWLAKRHKEVYRALFNMSAPALSAWCSAHLFFYSAGVAPLVRQEVALDQILLPLILFAVAYFSLNSWLIAVVIGLERRINPVKIWRESFLWLSLNYFFGASVAALIVVYNRRLDLGYIGVIVPLLLVLYFTFKTAMGRVEDADRHVEQLNTLYLSTIETLAMAIDAKDQITHGHIRRVQAYAVGLARRVGVADESLIKAIEAAALLHDTGKLAVPEYILNKPGKLTPAEFEKMKLHATVGADILSAINFPYPVVPIVRHHHENWDGTGYPTGLKGTDIPIGARILSVVDCFDALTSDRPYRPRLSDEDALGVLAERRGSMYDPLMVDTFARIHKEIAPSSAVPGPPPKALNEITISTQAPETSATPSLDDITASAGEMLTLYELARALSGQTNIADTGDLIAKHLRRLIPCSLCVFYLYDSATDELEARHALGEYASVVRAIRIPLGHRLSGWVAANRQSIVNSDAMLDLGEVARQAVPRLRSCLSAAMTVEGSLVGVLTLYSESPRGFSDDHRRVLEAVSNQIAETFKRTADLETPTRDVLSVLPNLANLERLVDGASVAIRSTPTSRLGLLVITAVELSVVIATHGHQGADEVLRQIIQHTKGALRATDVLFRHGDDAIVALIENTDVVTLSDLAGRLRQAVEAQPVAVHPGVRIRHRVTVEWVVAPLHGSSLQELLTTAQALRGTRPDQSDGQTLH